MDWFLLIVLGGVILLLPTAYAGIIGAPYAPTRLAAVRRALATIKLGKDDVLVDLGAGDGKILRAAGQLGARTVGYELSPIMWVVARLRAWNSQLHFGNFYTATLPADTTVIFIFLMPKNMARVRHYVQGQKLPKLRAMLAYAFPFEGLTPQQIIREPNCAPLYVYDITSTWQSTT